MVGFQTILKRQPDQQGFTLVETLVAMVLFTVILLGTLGGLAAVIRANTQGGKGVRAMLLAQEKIEQLRAGGYADLASGSDVVGSFSLSWTVVSGPLADTRQVDIEVAWTAPKAGQVNLTTVLSQ
ncbi:MAG: prepilin-type N-terminal cleavage/methylation domain-containing protein [Candidatus Tectomicrobia bacterium]|uniref:Prepilin-type N-terminal cleavage/methylation domain-containing protein n=1 Tax=Tectimicrobiota bacterium TaxID=2528274 RepID=A0A932FVU5_UNCTE|nr:prepilin-type N-terminal cleavage/methylation domain-containing protein [Candidatus Tectomicrobia bacterium]